MTIHFHPPQDPKAYSEKVLTILLEAVLPAAREQLGQLIQKEDASMEPSA